MTEQEKDIEELAEEAEIICIQDEDGKDVEFEVIAKFEVDDSDAKYMMVVPLEGEDDDVDDVYAFRYEENGDDLTLHTIEDEDEWNIVEETFNTLIAEMEQEES